MNTVAKGDLFEDTIYKYLKEEIESGQFFTDKDKSRIFPKKAYYSHARQKDIIFDIAIEVYRPGQSGFSFLILIECKDYSSPVKVDDVEEFHSKVQQVAGVNVKGIFASTNSFQSGALTFAKSQGIALLRYYNRDELKWEVPRYLARNNAFGQLAPSLEEVHLGLTEEHYDSLYLEAYCYYDDNYTNSIIEILRRLAGCSKQNTKQTDENHEEVEFAVPYIAPEQLKTYSEKTLRAIEYHFGAVDLNRIVELYADKELSLIIDDREMFGKGRNRMLGKLTFTPPTITIFVNNHHTRESQRFTIAHELGHFILGHGDYMYREYYDVGDWDQLLAASSVYNIIDRMEYQANHFASNILLPEHELLSDFQSLLVKYEIKDRGCGLLYLDDQKCNQDSFHNVANELRHKYQVSKMAIKYRLKNLGLLQEPDTKLRYDNGARSNRGDEI
ncbi:MAG: hypothetical protein CL946_11605 [Ectothiorhodospiraceae bacterium]|nr:hypothetical protein [Ectothiorhodospiraceae bacterium]